MQITVRMLNCQDAGRCISNNGNREGEKEWEKECEQKKEAKTGRMLKIKATLNDFGSLALCGLCQTTARSDTDANNASHRKGKGQR